MPKWIVTAELALEIEADSVFAVDTVIHDVLVETGVPVALEGRGRPIRVAYESAAADD